MEEIEKKSDNSDKKPMSIMAVKTLGAVCALALAAFEVKQNVKQIVELRTENNQKTEDES